MIINTKTTWGHKEFGGKSTTQSDLNAILYGMTRNK